MKAKDFLEIVGADFFTGVPDSLLKPLCDEIYNQYGISDKHIVGANEGNCVAIASGYHLATGKVPLVYLQNSGLGNIINPVASLLNDKVYGIPCIFVVGWRGEPDVKDEPQHIFQGEVTLKLLEDIDVKPFVIDKTTSFEDVKKAMEAFKSLLSIGKSVAFVVKKGAFISENAIAFSNENKMSREEIVERIAVSAGESIVVSTTGKASRELFEIREKNKQDHKYDFLTVGSMGHSSSIALGIALNKKNQKIYCIDGDGAMLMHMGSMGVIGDRKPKNLIHILINNAAHETVGGMPTVAGNIDFITTALACGYEKAVKVSSFDELDKELELAKNSNQLVFIEAISSLGAREDLGRPTTTARENKEEFMKYLSKIN